MKLSQRAKKAHSLPRRKLVFLSVSQVLVVSAVVTLLLLNFTVSLDFDPLQRVLMSLWALALLLGSYVLYRRVRSDIDILDYLGSLVFYHRLRNEHPELDFTNTLLFFGILAISISPLLYSYLQSKGLPPTYATFTLFLGGILIAVAVSGYVLLEESEG